MVPTDIPGRFFQLGMVVPDMAAALDYMRNRMGTGRFMPIPGEPTRTWFRGEMIEITYDMNFGYLGDIQIELILPRSDRSTYAEYLQKVPGGGVHHFGFEVEDFDAAEVDLESRGYRPVQKGSFGGTRFNYYESDNDPGALVEILYLDQPVQDMFEAIRSQSF